MNGERTRLHLVETLKGVMHCIECEHAIRRDANGVWRHLSGWHRCVPYRNDSYATPAA